MFRKAFSLVGMLYLCLICGCLTDKKKGISGYDGHRIIYKVR